MFVARKIESREDWLDPDGIKIYTLSAYGNTVDQSKFMERLKTSKSMRPILWRETPAYVIFHEGESYLYLVLAWWGNDNELFTATSVLTEDTWIEDPERFSFCLYDLEIFWAERNIYINTMYSGSQNIDLYRQQRFAS